MTTRTLTLLVFAACALAQPKPTLTPADCGKWETLGAGTLSPDGKWLAYEIRRTIGNHELRVAATAGGGKTHVLAFCSGAAFSADSRYLACSATVSEAEQDRARKAGRPVQDKLNVLDLGSGEIAKVDDVQSLAFSGVGPYLAFRKYPPAGAGRGGDGAAPAAVGVAAVRQTPRRMPSATPSAPSCWCATSRPASIRRSATSPATPGRTRAATSP